MRMLETNPTYTEARGKVSAQDMMFAHKMMVLLLTSTMKISSTKQRYGSIYNDGKTEKM